MVTKMLAVMMNAFAEILFSAWNISKDIHMYVKLKLKIRTQGQKPKIS